MPSCGPTKVAGFWMSKVFLQNFLDAEGKLTAWPSKRSKRLLVMEYLVQKFESDKTFTEKEVNDILNSWHTFGDWAVLRRALVDYGFLTRDRAGLAYRRLR